MTAQQQLSSYIDDLLDGALGAVVRANRHRIDLRRYSEIVGGTLMALVYFVVFVLGPLLVAVINGGEIHPVIALSVWGTFYLWFAAVTARATSESVEAVLQDIVIPNLSDPACAEIHAKLRKRFREGVVHPVTLSISYFIAFMTWLALMYDIGPYQPVDWSGPEDDLAETLQIAWCATGYFLLYILAARATYFGFFYVKFAQVFREQAGARPFDPTHSVLVKGIGLVGRRMLVFWVFIALSVATLPMIFPELTAFLVFVLPTAVFFSLVCGSAFYLTAEANLRHVVTVHRARQLLLLEQEISTLFDRRADLAAEDWTQLETLQNLKNQLVQASGYGNAALSVLSVLIPILPPVLSLLIQGGGAFDAPSELFDTIGRVLSGD